jgi:RNA 2',3'-cyclic 3'-phosphodiesterase
MRLFIASDFNDDIFEQLQEKIIDSSAKLSITHSYHITLKFLGDVSEDKIGLICERLSKIQFEPFIVTLDKIGVFPSENNARVIWVGIKKSEEMLDLQRKVDDSLKGMFPLERNFFPHITLARVKDRVSYDYVTRIMQIQVPSKTFNVDKFILFKSTLMPSGPVYEEIGRFGGEN